MSHVRLILWALLPFCPTLAGLAYYKFWWRSHEGVPVRLDVSTTVANIRTGANRSLPINHDLAVKGVEISGPFEAVRISRAHAREAMCDQFSGTKQASFQVSGSLGLEWISLGPAAAPQGIPFQISQASNDLVQLDGLNDFIGGAGGHERLNTMFDGRFLVVQPGKVSWKDCQCADRRYEFSRTGLALDAGTLVEFHSAKRVRLSIPDSTRLFEPFEARNISFFERVDGVPESRIMPGSTMALEWPEEKPREIQLLVTAEPVSGKTLSIDSVRLEKGAMRMVALGRLKTLVAGQANDYRDALPGFLSWMKHDYGWVWFSTIVVPLIAGAWNKLKKSGGDGQPGTPAGSS
jgi:hypothetical protein